MGLSCFSGGTAPSNFGMRLGGDELIGDKKLFFFVVGLLREYEMAQVVEDCAFVAGGAGELVLGL